MISLSKTKGFDYNSIKNRIIKVLQYGAKTALQAAPFGDDSNPIKEMTAIFANTETNDEPVIIGYVNENQLAAEGEKRAFSLKPDGTVSFYTWLKNDGTFEIGGNTDNLIRFNLLNNGLQQEVLAMNVEFAKISAAMTALGGSYVMQPVNLDITPSKIEEIKCT